MICFVVSPSIRPRLKSSVVFIEMRKTCEIKKSISDNIEYNNE